MSVGPVVLVSAASHEVPVPLPGEPPRPGAHRVLTRGGGAYLFVGVRGGGTGPRDGRDVRVGPGDICFYDADRPPLLDSPEPVRLKVFLVPREALGLEAGEVARVLAAPVVGRSARLGALLSPFLSELADTLSSAEPQTGEMLAWNAVNLLATLATEQLGRETAGVPDSRAPLLSGILRFIDLHLADADLSPETIAASQHISVRYLHRLFQDEGTTVGRWIQRRRLEECRRDLTQGVRGHRTIAAVAGRWGFLSATHFSRVFRAAYGMSPSEWRDSAGRGTRTRGR
ncbi:helix-turn-helix domain-containing protein [Streptomyces graminofaciens]|nr:helix-turn-helix domain-containing protein [Streptomyces graminofaciens]